MTLSLYLQCVLMFVLGQAAHLFLVKVPAVKERCRVANKPFAWKEWWRCDWNVIIGTQIIGALLIVGLDQFLHWKPQVLDYVKWFFAAVGAFGSTVAMAKMSQFEKSLNNVIDIKTDIADEKEKP
jgi:hypothetical protein